MRYAKEFYSGIAKNVSILVQARRPIKLTMFRLKQQPRWRSSMQTWDKSPDGGGAIIDGSRLVCKATNGGRLDNRI